MTEKLPRHEGEMIHFVGENIRPLIERLLQIEMLDAERRNPEIVELGRSLRERLEAILRFCETLRGGRRTEVCLLDLLASAVMGLRDLYPCYRIELSCEPSCRLIARPGDLGILILHLVMNACAKSPCGSVVQIEVGGGHCGILLRVRDNGAGMSADRCRVYAQSLMCCTAEFWPGGHNVLRPIILSYGATAEVISAVGVGTTVTILFPGVRNNV